MDLKNELYKILERLTEETGLVGGMFAIIRHGKPEQIITYGYADRENKIPVTEQTYFAIASCSKAFTTMLAAQACDKGLLDWDAPVSSYLPQFGLIDEYASAHISARDLASHRTGVPGHDFLRNKVLGDRENLTAKTKYLDMNTGFRQKYQYNNHMYIVLGYLLEQLNGGKSWEQLVQEGIAGPLGIENIRFRSPDLSTMDGLERALPYVSNGFKANRCGDANNAFSAPCGGIKINIQGLCKWIGAMSRGGEFDGGKLCSPKQFKELTTAVIPCDEDYHELKNGSYALAWKNSVYNNRTVINHSGGLEGFVSQVGFLPELDCGYAMSFNTGSTPVHNIARAFALDYLTTGAPKEDYGYLIEEWKRNRDAALAPMHASVRGEKITVATNPALVGEYEHPAYTTFEIVDRDGQLWFVYGDFEAALYRKDEHTITGYTGTLDGLVPDMVELFAQKDGLLLRTSDSQLKMSFKKVN